MGLEFILPLLVAVGILGFFVWMSMPRAGQQTLEERLTTLAERPKRLEEIELELPFTERVIRPMMAGAVRFLGNMSPAKGAERTRINLAMAGNPNNMQVTEYMGMRAVAAVGLFVLTLLLTILVLRLEITNVILFSVIGMVLGYMAPVYWLGSRIKRRQKNILKGLPDAIDLLTICVEAGLAFDGAVQRLVDKADNEISYEFRRFLNETRVGKPRREALRELSARTGVPDMAQFIASIIQADQLGVSMSKVLRIQADQMRIKRRQRAEEQAHRAPIIMIFPMVFLIFPAMYVVILGPSVPRFLAAFGVAL